MNFISSLDISASHKLDFSGLIVIDIKLPFLPFKKESYKKNPTLHLLIEGYPFLFFWH